MSSNVKYCDILKYGIFVISISVLGALSSLYAEQTTNLNSILETIVQGVSYRDSLIKSAVVNFNFEKYQMCEPGATEDNVSKKGQACFIINGDKMRLDMDYKQTLDADVHGRGGKISVRKETYYYSPNGLQVLNKVEKKLTIEDSPAVLSVLPFSFGLNWDINWETKLGVKRFGDTLSKLMKQGVLNLGGEEVLEGTKCYVLERIYPRGNRYKCWIAPSKGYSAMRVTMSELASKGDSKRELILFERVCTVTNIADDLWFPVSGVEKYYAVDPSSKTIENIKLYIDRETRIDVTGYELNKVSDKDVTLPDFNSGEYNSVWDRKIKKLIHLTNNPNMKN